MFVGIIPPLSTEGYEFVSVRSILADLLNNILHNDWLFYVKLIIYYQNK